MSTIGKTQRAILAGVLGATAVMIGCSRDRNDDRLGPEDFREPYEQPAGKPVDDPALDPLREGADPAIGADERALDPLGEGAQGAVVEPGITGSDTVAVQGIDSTQSMERGGYGIVSVAGTDATGEQQPEAAAADRVARPGVTTIIRGDGSDPIVLGGVAGGGAAGGVARGEGDGAFNDVGGTGVDPNRGSTAGRDWTGGDVGDDVVGATDTDDDNFGEPAPRGLPATERDRSAPAAGRVLDRGAPETGAGGNADGFARSRATTGGASTTTGGFSGTTTGGAAGTTTGGARGTTTGGFSGTTTGGAAGTTAGTAGATTGGASGTTAAR
jgi:hypothetical protein